MSRLTCALCLLVSSLLFLASCASVPAGNPDTGYTIHGFVGKDSQTAAAGTSVLLIDGGSGQVMASDQTDFFGKFGFPGLQPGHYQLKVGEIVQDIVVAAENVRRDIDLSDPTGSMNYAAAGTKELTDQLTAAATGKPAPAGPNDAELASQIAGTWWGYSGSTETKIGLCPDGSYADFSESGYSGTMSDAGGNQTGAWGATNQSGGQGVWSIQGTTESGTISVRYSNGQTATIQYQQCGESGCLLFDGRKLCRTSASCE
jgi:hypothetical protein